LRENEFILNLIKFEKIKLNTFLDCGNETPKTFYILYLDVGIDQHYSELHSAMFEPYIKCQSDVEVTDGEVPMYHFTQMDGSNHINK
jgi:hypothetical protein